MPLHESYSVTEDREKCIIISTISKKIQAGVVLGETTSDALTRRFVQAVGPQNKH